MTLTKTRTSALRLLLLGVAALTMLACSGGGGAAASVTPPPDAAASIEANNLKFSTAELAVPAGAPFKLFFKNLEGAPHNVAIYKIRRRARRSSWARRSRTRP